MNRLSSPSLRTAAAILLLVLIAMPFWARNASSQAPEEEAAPIAQEEEITAPSSSTVPIFSYQGQLLDNDGNPITADLPMTFRLYDVATDGTACWTEEHSAANNISVANGLFHVLLGQITAIDPAACLSADTYLELEINGEPLTPRELLTDVAKAVEAGTVPDGSITPQKLDINSDIDMEGNQIINVAALENSGAALNPQANGWLRLISPGGVVAFIDSDNNQTDTAFAIYKNNYFFNLPVSEIFRVAENGDTRIVGNATVEGNNFSMGGDVVLRHDENRWFHLIPWGGSGRAYDGVCIGCGAPADLIVRGNLDVSGTCSLAAVDGNTAVASADETCTAGSITSGAYIEANLQTPPERRAGGNKGFSEGDLLCWGEDKLELCETPNDSLVQGVADAKGSPIVLGAEPIKVIGKVEKGDYLVASSVPGYAMASKNPTFGIVIAQALEDFEGEKGLIKAMIRKM